MSLYLSDIIRLITVIFSSIGLIFWIKVLAEVYLANRKLNKSDFFKTFFNLFSWVTVSICFILGQIAYWESPLRYSAWFFLFTSMLIIVASHNYHKITTAQLRDLIQNEARTSYETAQRQLARFKASTQELLEEKRKKIDQEEVDKNG